MSSEVMVYKLVAGGAGNVCGFYDEVEDDDFLMSMTIEEEDKDRDDDLWAERKEQEKTQVRNYV